MNIVSTAEELKSHDYVCMFGWTPRLAVGLPDGDIQICLADNADYIEVDEALERLKRLSKLLKKIRDEVQKK